MAFVDDLGAELAVGLVAAARRDQFRARADLTRDRAARSNVAAQLRDIDYALRFRVYPQLGRVPSEDERRRIIEALVRAAGLRFPGRIPILLRAASNDSFGDVLDELWDLLDDLARAS